MARRRLSEWVDLVGRSAGSSAGTDVWIPTTVAACRYTKAARMLQTWFRRKLRGALIVASIMEDEQRLRGRKKVKEILVYMLFLVCFSAVYIWTTEDQGACRRQGERHRSLRVHGVA